MAVLSIAILAALVAPFVIHELGHSVVAWHRTRTPPTQFFRRKGLRLIWDIPPGLNPRESREILIAGFVAEMLFAAPLALAALLDARTVFLTALYVLVTAGHLWHYAVTPGEYDDLLSLSLFRGS